MNISKINLTRKQIIYIKRISSKRETGQRQVSVVWMAVVEVFKQTTSRNQAVRLICQVSRFTDQELPNT